MNVLNTILASSRTVFTIQSLTLMMAEQNKLALRQSLNYFVKKGDILNPRRGIYTKLAYNEQELACAILQPSYISLEYVLARAGVTFQYSEQITCISYQTKDVEIEEKTISFRKINPMIWTNLQGIDQCDNIAIATPERAFLDMVYLSAGNCYFDNLRPLDKKKVRDLLPLYSSQVLTARVNELLK